MPTYLLTQRSRAARPGVHRDLPAASRRARRHARTGDVRREGLQRRAHDQRRVQHASRQGAWISSWVPYNPGVGTANVAGAVVAPAAIAPGAVTLAAKSSGDGARRSPGRVTQGGQARRCDRDDLRRPRRRPASSRSDARGWPRTAHSRSRRKIGTFFRARAVAAPGAAARGVHQLRPLIGTVPCVNPTANGFTVQSKVVRKKVAPALVGGRLAPAPYASPMPATVRLGTCSFADEGLVKTWYPRGISTPKARLGYYAEWFDTVEVDSPYYHLPDPAVTGRWAQRTPPEFTFHVKAHASMTGHEPAEQTDGVRRVPRVARAARAVREAPRDPAAVPPAVRRSRPRRRRSSRPSATSSTRSSRSSSSGTARGSRRTSAPTPSRSSSATASHTCPSTRRARARRTSCRPSRRRHTPSRTCASTAATRRRGTSAPRSPGTASTGCTRRRSSRSGSTTSADSRSEADEVYALFNNNRDDFAPRSAAILRGLLDEAGVAATGGVEPPPLAPTLF